MIWRDVLPYFSQDELECSCCGQIALDNRFAATLPALRQAWGNPLVPNSVTRCKRWNTSVGGHPRSMHLMQNPKWPTRGAMAADIAWRDWITRDKLKFARLAYSMGWSIGLHDGFIHVDRRKDLNMKELPQGVFLYGPWSAPFAIEEIF